MFPEIVPLLQFAGLVAVGLLLRSRVMLLLVAAVMAGLVVFDIHPSNLAARTPQELAMDFGGVAVGLLAGLWAAATSRQRVDAKRWARDIEASSPRSRDAEPVPRRSSPVVWLFASLLVALAAGAGLYLEGATVPAVRTTVDGWLDSPMLRAFGLPGLPTQGGQAMAPSVPPAPALAPTPTPAADKPRARHASTGERQAGDMRHCLDQGGTSNVLRCAERGR
jgi:hypothetical protein